ncbi:pilus assembly protein PilM [Pontiella sp.]|uniref:pilus assembly protein PilM n=1 Tax=Pontiella sp. TaxID=2837462 RepID=UPI00356A0B43
MKADRFIALEIGPDFIRMGVFARRSPDNLELIDYGSIAIASDPAIEMAREALVATALKRLLDERKPAVRKAVVAIDGPSVFSRLVKLPPVAPEKVAQTIRHEAVQNIPFPIDEVVWDAHVVDAAAPEPEVLLVAVKAALVNGLVHAVAANGLQVERVDVAPAALANVVRNGYPGSSECRLLVDAGKDSTNLVFVDGDRVFFRSLPVGGSMGQRLVQEIQRSISFYCSQQGGNDPTRILLAGGFGNLGETESRLGIPVEAFNPLQGVRLSVVVADSADLAVLAGMAMPAALCINLVPEALEKERRLQKRQPLILACVAAAVLIGAVWIAGLRRMADVARREAAIVGARVAELELLEGELVPLERRIDRLLGRTEIYGEAVGQRTFWLETLQEIRTCLSDGMFLVGSEPLKDGEQTAGLRITVVSYLDKETKGIDAVVQLRDRLRESARFSDETKVFRRPTKRQFSRSFVLDVHFAEDAQ